MDGENDICKVPISHPFFYHLTAIKESYFNAILCPIIFEMLNYEMDFLKNSKFVLDIDDLGEMKRLLLRMKFHVTIQYEVDEFEKLLDELFYCEMETNEYNSEHCFYIMENTLDLLKKEYTNHTSVFFAFGDENVINLSTISCVVGETRKICRLGQTFWDRKKVNLFCIKSFG